MPELVTFQVIPTTMGLTIHADHPLTFTDITEIGKQIENYCDVQACKRASGKLVEVRLKTEGTPQFAQEIQDVLQIYKSIRAKVFTASDQSSRPVVKYLGVALLERTGTGTVTWLIQQLQAALAKQVPQVTVVTRAKEYFVLSYEPRGKPCSTQEVCDAAHIEASVTTLKGPASKDELLAIVKSGLA